MEGRGEYGADAFGRCVGTSRFAFWIACGHPRTLLRSSSGAKSSGLSHVPASRPITSSPACASGSAAAPPTAPRPTITTSVFFRSTAMVLVSRREERACRFLLREHRVVVRRHVRRRGRRLHALIVCRGDQPDAWIADQ